MKIFETCKDLPDDARNHVIAIGNFDGVHWGHQQLLQRGRDLAEDNGCKLGVLTFEPHPRRLFRADDPPFRITPPALKRERLAENGVDILYEIPFNWDFASQSAETFAQNVVAAGLAPVHIVVGYDFCFGQLRKGTPQTLIDAGLSVTTIDKITEEDKTAFSSSAIRAALRHGDIEKANELLGWEWQMSGIIEKGDRRGRELGYPTANVPLGETIHPAYGVYATWVQIEGEQEWRPAATNIGIRPMFEIPVGQVEAHILNFDADIYGKTLRVKPVKHLRGEAKFGNLEELTAQMAKDCEQAREILSSSQGNP